MTDQNEKADDHPMLPILRDQTFSRFVADEALITLLGRDIEVAFIQYGPLYTRQVDMGEEEATHATNVLTEVARMRMGFPSMVNMVMSFIQEGIQDGRLRAEAITRSINQWQIEAQQENAEEEL